MPRNISVLITGASGTIGKSIALTLAKEGYSLYLQGNKNIKLVHKLSSFLQQHFPNQFFIPLQADLSKEKESERLWGKITKEKLPLPTVLIHCAGQSNWQLFSDLDTDVWQKLQRTHLENPVFLTQSALSSMLAKGGGRVIFISSIWGMTGASCEVAYSSLKAAQIGFIKALAKEWAGSKITVNAVAPGVISTNMINHLNNYEKEILAEQIPMGRFGKAKEIAELVAFLVSEKSAYITGQVISPNGGFLC